MSIQQLFFAGGKLNEATGGTITYDGDYQIHTFTTAGTFTVTRADVPSTPVSVLLVGGGQAGQDGSSNGFSTVGGFGAQGGNGGEIVQTTLQLSTFTLNVGYGMTIAAGQPTSGASGLSTSFLSYTARGGQYATIGANAGAGAPRGGSGGSGTSGTNSSISGSAYVYGSGGGGSATGATWPDTTSYSGGTAGTGAGNGGNSGQPGGNGVNGTNYGAGGGGGAGANGTGNGTNFAGGIGGDGAPGVLIIRFQYKNL